MLINIVVAIQILAALVMAGLVLVQHGKGADMGAAFGSGSSGSLFGASGSANFLSRMTAVAATVFFASTLSLAFLASEGIRQPTTGGSSVLESAVPFAPAVPESGAVSAIPGIGDVPPAPVPAVPEVTAPSSDALTAPEDGTAVPPADPTEAAPTVENADQGSDANPPASDAVETESVDSRQSGEIPGSGS